MQLTRLFKSVREYKRATIVTPIFMAAEAALECLLPLAMAKLVDTLYGGQLSALLKIGLLLVGMSILSLTCGSIAGATAARASCGFGKNLRHDLFYAVQNFSFSNIDKFSASGLVTRLTTDVQNVQNAFHMTIRIAVRLPLMFTMALVMSFTVSVKMTCIFLCVIPVLAITFTVLILKAHPIFEDVVRQYDGLNDKVHENIKAMRVVKAYVREEHECDKFDRAAEDIRTRFTRAERIISITQPVMWGCIFTVMILLCAFGAKLTVGTFGGYEGDVPKWGELSTGDFAALFAYAAQILSSLVMFASVLVQIVLATASARRINEVLDERSDIVSPAENAVTTVADGSVDFCDVSFKYAATAERDALSGIDLHIRSGETIGILGGTGSGKSSLVQLVPRLYDATRGKVLVGGVDVRDYDLNALRGGVAMVLQKNLLFSGTIADNLRWGNADATDEQLRHAAHLACADEFIDKMPLGYDTHIEQGGANVSGGQRQRLTIARALLKNPKILILDDSTSAVDTHTDALIRKAFREEIPDTTKIIIAQRVTSVMDADRIVVLDGGGICGIGTHESLLADCAVYREVYASQQNAEETDETEKKENAHA